MNTDVYRKIAVELAAKAGSSPVAFVLTSSSPKVDTSKVADGLLQAFGTLQMKTARVDVRNKDIFSALDQISEPDGPAAVLFSNKEGWTADNAARRAEEIVQFLHSHYDIAIFSAGPLAGNDAAMLLTAACGYAVLLEEEKTSRTDEIDRALESIRDLGAQPLGFILK